MIKKEFDMYRFFLLFLTATLLLVSCPGEGDETNKLPVFPGWGIGVNIGNTFDSLNTNNIAGETGWGNPPVDRAYIQALKGHGFKTVRLPVSWVDYMDDAPNYTIDSTWMNRVEEVVNWILDEDMYCILNLHHDGGGTETNNRKYWIKKIAIPEREDEVTDRFIKVWNQIAVRFRGASDKLILESMNEVGFDSLWNRYQGGQAEKKAEAFRLLNKLNQVFVDTVRATGGKNETRSLLIAGYWTDITNTCEPAFKMPDDTTDGKMILSVHYYTPWDFCGGKAVTWGSTANINELNRLFNMLKTNFIDNGVPVILGEYGVDIQSRTNGVTYIKEPESRVKWMTEVTQICINMGICPVLWDTGMRPNNQGMADIQREAPFAISADLKAMLQGLKQP
ncbi:MAG: glycoside hydrolase family 5 protein [Treponema sp.]|jgi:endoglucanase|nr:glycoside hydrolase family 5 protein [Treponema sp.]